MVEYIQKDSYDINDLIEIVKILRSKDGCPWDKVQTHKSIRNDFLEETCEAMEAIDCDDPEMLCEELGDVLLQVVFHSSIETDKNSFNFDDVCDGICKKLIVRHPHVFSNVKVDGTDDVLKNWDKIKKETKQQQTYTDTLKGVASTFPALMKAQKVGKRAMRAGFDFEDTAGAMEKVEEELSELKSAISLDNKEKIFEEFGDLLFACTNVARKLGVDSELALTKATDKFILRFETVENKVLENGKDMKELSLEELDAVWNEIKSNNNDK